MAAAGRFHVVFAGGYGTLDELLEVIAWAQLGIHSKPVSAVLVPLLLLLGMWNTHGALPE
jgi:cytokinin riboside 5'-monophosphate phosphoribohydrolase